MKLCIDCKWILSRDSIHNTKWCGHEKLFNIDPVDGTKQYNMCTVMRHQPGNLCGLAGNLWEARNEAP